MTIQSEITTALEIAFQPSEITVENESYRHSVPPDSETHFKVVLVTDQFAGERSVKRHQRVYGVLAEWLAGPVHALALHLYSPEEWEATGQSAPESPNCMGGSKKDPAMATRTAQGEGS